MKREQDHSGRRQGLLSSGKKFTGSGVGAWPRRCAMVAATAAWAFLPVEVSDASWLSDVFSPKPDKAPKQVISPKQATVAKPAAAAKSPAKLAAPKPVVTVCNPSKFRLVLDVGHTAA